MSVGTQPYSTEKLSFSTGPAALLRSGVSRTVMGPNHAVVAADTSCNDRKSNDITAEAIL